MNDIQRVKKNLMKHAQAYFPAKELWIKPDLADLKFWAFDRHGHSFIFTEGFCRGNVIKYRTTEIMDIFIEDIIREKQVKGYECFAMQI